MLTRRYFYAESETKGNLDPLERLFGHDDDNMKR